MSNKTKHGFINRAVFVPWAKRLSTYICPDAIETSVAFAKIGNEIARVNPNIKSIKNAVAKQEAYEWYFGGCLADDKADNDDNPNLAFYPAFKDAAKRRIILDETLAWVKSFNQYWNQRDIVPDARWMDYFDTTILKEVLEFAGLDCEVSIYKGVHSTKLNILDMIAS